MKRVISIILVMCLLPAALAVPALAAEAVPASVYDLLTAVEYKITYPDGSSVLRSRASGYLSQDTYIEISWDPTVQAQLDRFVIGIQFASVPSKVEFYNGSVYVPLTYDSSAGGIHYFTMPGANYIPYFVRISFDSPVTGHCFIRSFYGFLDNAVEVDIVDYFSNAVVGDPTLGIRSVLTVDNGSSMLPVASDWYGPYDYPEGEELLYAECFYKASAPLPYAQSISYLVYTIGDIRNVGARVENSDGNIIAGLSSVVDSCGDSQIVVEFYEEMYRCKVYTVTVDLEGYDLTDRVITLSYEVLPVHSSGFTEYGWGFYSQLTAAAFLPMQAEPNFFARFVSWLRGRFDDVTSTISTWGQNIVDAINPPEADTSAGDTLVQQGQQIHEFEQQQQVILQDSVGTLQQFSNISGFSASLAFVSGYVTQAFDALGDFQIVITLPLVIGVILFLASRVRGYDKPSKHDPKPRSARSARSSARPSAGTSTGPDDIKYSWYIGGSD